MTRFRDSRRLTVLLCLAVVLVSGCGGSKPPAPAAAQEVRVPNPDVGADTLQARKRAQLETVNQFTVFHQFQFTDRIEESGITFVHHIVEDAGKHYKAVHYDHGNGIAVADVDGDGLYDIYFVNQVGGNELWKNLGGGRFKDITREAGVGLADRISVAASFADIDNDGDQDLFVTTVRGGNVLFENDGHGHFTDISKERRRRSGDAIPPARSSSTSTTTAWSTCWCAMSVSTRPIRRDLTAPTSGWPTRSSATPIRTASSIRSSTRTRDTIASRT